MARASRVGGILVSNAALAGQVILLVEDEFLIALDLRMALESAGATVVFAQTRDATAAVEDPTLTAAVLDARPGSSDHRPLARRLRTRNIPFLFYSTHPPADTTTIRGAPIFLKPGRTEDIVAAVSLLLRS